jgi:hypothetical protein
MALQATGAHGTEGFKDFGGGFLFCVANNMQKLNHKSNRNDFFLAFPKGFTCIPRGRLTQFLFLIGSGAAIGDG